ncbi:MAG TPA: hypothetical protein VJ933_04085 [Phaeodactylibacter sp.]|nr:hypothetical protein [Phaeodactylibacter sp.]
MNDRKDITTLLQEAEWLRRHWFRQLQALEGEEHWPEGWERLQELRSITLRIANAMERQGEEELDTLVEDLRRVLREAEEK